MKIEDNVSFLGAVDNKLVAQIFSSCLVSISSSIEEAYGLVNIEALREGTPIICTETAGSRDIISNNENGLFFNLQ